MLSLCHVHAVVDALYCGLVCMLVQAINNLYLMFSYIKLCCTTELLHGDMVKFLIIELEL